MINDDNIIDSTNELICSKENTIKIQKEFNTFKEKMNNFYNNINKIFSEFLKEKELCILWFNNIEKEKNNDNIKKLVNFCQNIHDNNNDYLKSINALNESLNKSINEIIEKLYPQNNDNANANNIINKNNISNNIPYDDYYINQQDSNKNNNSKNNVLEDYNIFVDAELEQSIDFNSSEFKQTSIAHKIQCEDDEDDKNENEKKNIDNDNKYKLICLECNIDIAVNKCSHCDKYFCSGCTDYLKEYCTKQEHIFHGIKDSLSNVEKKKIEFVKNFIIFIEHYLMKCNYILKSESINSLPLINNVNNFEYLKKYLNEINKLCENYKDDDNDIDGKLISTFNSIFKTRNLHISIDEDNSFLDEHFSIDAPLVDGIKNELFYFINIITKNNNELDSNICDDIINKISEILSTDKKNIFILNNNNKINTFAESKNFYELDDYNHLKIDNPICNELYELKLLLDEFLCNQCQIPKDYFDYRGNTLTPNSKNNLIRGTEKYDPPYGWIGIGLNVLGKYDNGNDEWLTNNTNSSEWAIAYHGLSPKNKADIIKKLLKYIIVKKDLKKAISKIGKKVNEKPNWGKGKGIYLTPNIGIAESCTGIISFNNKKYKVLFMSRVYIKGIREPENSNFWVLDVKDIRMYRILFKEVSE
jgi:hypothetical protein